MENEPESQSPSTAPAIQILERADWINLGIGLGIAAIFLKVRMLRFILSYLFILIHEFGHAVFGWLFAYPSIPRFDLYYGGGICTHECRSAFIYVILAFVFFLCCFLPLVLSFLAALYRQYISAAATGFVAEEV